VEELRTGLKPVVVGALQWVCDVHDGPTPEQQRLIETLASGLFDIAPGAAAHERPLAPAEVASTLPAPRLRRRMVQLAIILGFCRHPETTEQIGRVEELARELGIDGSEIAELRVLVSHSAEQATVDFVRRYDEVLDDLSEPTLVAPDGADRIPAIMASFAQMEEGSLGRAYLAFHERNGFTVPGPSTPEPAYYVSHDMNHVLAGYEPTGPGEIALGAFKLAMGDTEANWMAFMTNLLIQEVGLLKHGRDEQFVAYGGPIYPDGAGQGALHLDGAAELLTEAFARGLATSADFSQMDHIELAPRQLAELRAEFNVLGRADGYDGGTGGTWPA
jgi:hypothetical protein